jgi:hypothetical protein
MKSRVVWMCAACVAVLAGPAMAQGGGAGGEAPPGRPPRTDRPERQEGPGRINLTPEQREAAWKLEADGVAAGLNLSDEVAEKVTAIYVEARQSHEEKTAELRQRARERGGAGGGGGEGGGGAGGGGGEGGRGAGLEIQRQVQEITNASREALKVKLDEVLDGETLDKAAKSLGTFDARWDAMVHTVSGFGLESEAQYAVLWAVETYIVDSATARQGAAGGDREGMMQKMRAIREKLEADVKDILSAEQLAQLTRATGMGGGRGGPGGGGGGR